MVVDKGLPWCYGFFFSGPTHTGEQSFCQGRHVHSHEGGQEHYSKLTKREADPENLERGSKE